MLWKQNKTKIKQKSTMYNHHSRPPSIWGMSTTYSLILKSLLKMYLNPGGGQSLLMKPMYKPCLYILTSFPPPHFHCSTYTALSALRWSPVIPSTGSRGSQQQGTTTEKRENNEDLEWQMKNMDSWKEFKSFTHGYKVTQLKSQDTIPENCLWVSDS